MKNNNLKNTFFVLSAFLTLAIVVSGCSLTDDKDSKKDEKNPEQATSQENISKSDLEDLVFADEFDTDEYYNEVATAVKNIQIDIASKEAQEAKDITKCEMLSDEETVGSCKNDYYVETAKTEKSTETCANITDEGKKMMCNSLVVNEVASSAETAADCESLTEESDVQNCKDTLLRKEAMDNLDTTKCDEISNPVMGKACTDMVEARKAKEETQE